MVTLSTNGAAAGDLIGRLRGVVGDSGVTCDPDEMAGYLTDWRNAYAGASAAVVRPGSTDEVAAVMRLCHEAGVAVVPQGGNTGLCGGAVPDLSGRQVVLSLTRMRRIRGLDVANQTITVEAGVVLRSVQDAAAEVGQLFPLSLGAEGSCTIGGNLATNAGGTAVLRYGTMRELTLGLEVVLPDGRIWNGLRGLRKDNTGYDLKHLFIGAEGTLGVITAAVLKLFPAVRSRGTTWVALPGPQAAVDLIGILRELAGDRLTGFELMSRQSVDFVLRHVPGARDPFRDRHPWYALVELSDPLPNAALDEVIESALEEAIERGLVWTRSSPPLRRRRPRCGRCGKASRRRRTTRAPASSTTSPFPSAAFRLSSTAPTARWTTAVPGVRVVAYGHVGDGNLHYNLSKPEGYDDNEFRSLTGDLAHIIYDQTSAFNGSISAEHGLGQSKRDIIADYKDSYELDLMRGIKNLFDPLGLMNPGKLLPE